MRYDPERLRAHKKDFTFFQGYVPPIILSVSRSDMIKRIEFLENLGIKKEIASLDNQYKLSKKKSNDMRKYEIGYTTGVYDLFHIGHLNLLKNAKGLCDKLVVGVTVDELVVYKGKQSMIPFEDRIELVRSCKYVDAAIPQYDMDKLSACKKLGAEYLFVGDDWYGSEKWKKYEEDFVEEGIKIVYFPYTKGISSTKIQEALKVVRKHDLTDVK